LSVQVESKRGIFQRIRNKARYGLLFQEILDRIQLLGIHVEPYYLELEGLFNGPIPILETGFEGYEAGFLTEEEARTASELGERKIGEQKALEWLKDGKKCFGIKFRGDVVSYVWCNLKDIKHLRCPRLLNEDEAYLFGSYTLQAHRGKNIAPYTRYQLYKELAKTGRRRIYSITTYFNTSSRRFKEKLRARPVDLYLYIGLFRKWKFNFHIKKIGPVD
jgi:hypothetical protein